jgi:hypothetical protein
MNAIERLHEAFRRRIKTQTALARTRCHSKNMIKDYAK